MKKISFGCLAISYFVTVLVFAVVYLFAWDYSPDNFIINQEFNLFPMNHLRELVDFEMNTNLQSAMPAPTGIYQSADVQQKVTELVRERQTLLAEANDLQSKLAAQRQAELEIDKQESAAWKKNTDAYWDREFTAILAEGARLTNAFLIAKSNADATTNAIQRLSLVKVEADASIALADYRVRQAKKEYEVYSNIVANIGAFQDTNFVTRLRGEFTESHVTELLIETNWQAQANFRGEVWDYSSSLRQQQINRMGFVDFLYFSLGVSTTTTFGDIIPNSRFVRLMVIIQLVVCLLIVGLFVAHLGDRILQKREANFDS